MISAACVLAVPVIIAPFLRLVNYGRWAWGNGYRRGAIGIYVIAALSLVAPLALLLRRSL